jgi:tRNA modification GTPase
MAGGALSRQVDDWRMRVLTASASVEAVLDFGDEDDVADLPADFIARINALATEVSDWLSRPRAETLREGFRVVLAGPPNAGKSTLFNALVEDEAAITAPLAGTTRDVLTRAVAIGGVPFVFADTAGLRDETDDVIEAIGICQQECFHHECFSFLSKLCNTAGTNSKTRRRWMGRALALRGVRLDALD